MAVAALRGDIALGLIADGVHVAPTMAVLLQRLAPGQPPGRQALSHGRELHWERQRLWLACQDQLP